MPPLTSESESDRRVDQLWSRLTEIVRQAPEGVLLVDEVAGDRTHLATVARVLDIPRSLAYDTLQAARDRGLLDLEKIGTKTIGIRSVVASGCEPEIPSTAKRVSTDVQLKVSQEQQLLEWLAARGGRYVVQRGPDSNLELSLGRDSGLGREKIKPILKYFKFYALISLHKTKARDVLELTDAGWTRAGGRPEGLVLEPLEAEPVDQPRPSAAPPTRPRRPITSRSRQKVESKKRQRAILRFLGRNGDGIFLIPTNSSWLKEVKRILETDDTKAAQNCISLMVQWDWIEYRKYDRTITMVMLTKTGWEVRRQWLGKRSKQPPATA